jgi:hypothetical protein
MTNDALERELSRVLHELPGEPAAHPGRLREVQRRSARIRKQRYAAAAALVVIFVAAIAAVPFGLRDGHGGQQKQIPSTEPSAWPTRGALAGDASIRTHAIAAWQRALTAAHRGRLHETVHEVYADHIRGVGVVVVLSGVEPRGSDRTVIVSGADSDHLRVYADESASPSAITVLFGPRIRTGSRGCPVTNKASTRWTLFVLGPPGTTSARFQAEHATPPMCIVRHTGPWHAVSISDGAGSTVLTDPAIDLRVDGGGSSSDFSGIGGRSPVERLGGRVAQAAPAGELNPLQTTVTTGPNSGGATATAGGETGDPLGWQQRSDASSPIDALATDKAANSGSTAMSFAPESTLALPDGALTQITVGRGSTGPERLFLIAGAHPDRDLHVYIDRVLEPGHLPVEISAIVNGRDSHRWLFVAGKPGVASIDYRPAGNSHWQALRVYQSTAYASVGAGDHSGDRIRLRLANGHVVYEGPIDALVPLHKVSATEIG